jgi:hypothetical protein
MEAALRAQCESGIVDHHHLAHQTLAPAASATRSLQSDVDTGFHWREDEDLMIRTKRVKRSLQEGGGAAGADERSR